MKDRLSEEVIAMRAAKELKPGDYCNLGSGLPGLCAMYVPEGVRFQSEMTIIGYGSILTEDKWEEADYDHIDASGHFVLHAPGESYFDFLTSFIMIRSGRLYTVLGALQVSEKGDLAIHALGDEDEYLMIGGAMDLAWGGKRVIVTMTHTTKEGQPKKYDFTTTDMTKEEKPKVITKEGKPKIVKELSLPVTAKQCVDLIVTDVAVIEVSGPKGTKEGLILKEVAPGWSAEEVQAITEPRLIVAPDLKEIEL